MAKTVSPLLPYTSELLAFFGDRLRLARLRRKLTAKQVAALAGGMAPMTLRSVELGGAGVTIGAYLAVMQVLGIEHDLNQMAHTDLVGRELQDARLLSKGKPRPAAKHKAKVRRARVSVEAPAKQVVELAPLVPIQRKNSKPKPASQPTITQADIPSNLIKIAKTKKDKGQRSSKATQWDWIANAEQPGSSQ